MSTKYEYYNTGDDNNGGGSWSSYKLCQTFTPTTNHKITSVKLLLLRAGNPGTITVGIYNTTDNPAYPTGNALCSGTTNGNTLPTGSPYEWREITLGDGYDLVAGTTYAIVTQGSGGNGSNAVYWRCDTSSPTYSGGMYGRSTSSGTWGTAQMDNSKDDLFEEWGEGGQVETLRPNAAGDEKVLIPTPGTGEDNWEDVDEVSPDEDTTYVYHYWTVTYKRDLYNIQNHSAGSGTINFVKVYARCASASTPNQASLKIALKTGGTAYESSAITVTTSYTNYSNQWTTNPQTGAAWTWDEIDTLQAGVVLRSANGSTQVQTRCTQVYVGVDYTIAAAEKTSSDTGSGADAYVSLQMTEAKTSSDTGSGVEGTPLPSATLAGSETGSGIEAFIARLLATIDSGTGTEASSLFQDLFRELFATELGQGIDALAVKREIFAGGEGTKFFGGGHEPPHRAS